VTASHLPPADPGPNREVRWPRTQGDTDIHHRRGDPSLGLALLVIATGQADGPCSTPPSSNVALPRMQSESSSTRAPVFTQGSGLGKDRVVVTPSNRPARSPIRADACMPRYTRAARAVSIRIETQRGRCSIVGVLVLAAYTSRALTSSQAGGFRTSRSGADLGVVDLMRSAFATARSATNPATRPSDQGNDHWWSSRGARQTDRSG